MSATPELELAGDDGTRQLLEVRHDYACAQTRVRCDHAAERDTERELGDERVGAESDHGRMQPGELLEIAGQVACLRKDAPGVLEHQLAGFRGHERTRRAAEQIHPQRGLDRGQSLPKQFRR